MRSYGVAVLVLAIVTECFTAHSDRSRQRSGPIRSVPVAANIKRDAEFDCPEEFGYYPHPTDCSLYYVCVFGGALLESCTGGLMYSHELQTCDWPRNVGCDSGSSAFGDEELERISERDPPPPPPRRTPPPPTHRVQPNPVVTSRGQPKFNRDEYEKQQQLYAEVDDLPPVEEIENDRQQRVYRGQPSTIGQVQKDRDGYSQVNPGRNLNSNIIPASISQNNGKIGSFSFGTQVDERRTATATQAPQTYSETVTDIVDRQFDIETNEITVTEVIEKPLLRRKRDLLDIDVGLNKSDSLGLKISDRISNDEEMEYLEFNADAVPSYGDERGQDESERGKRQIRYYLKNGYKTPGKNWGVPKQFKLLDYRHLNYNPNVQNIRNHGTYEGLATNKLPEVTQNPHSLESISPANQFYSYQSENLRSQIPFRPSLPDPLKGKQQSLSHNPANIPTQIITKSPPISSLQNYENPFSALAGGFYNNAPRQNSAQANRPYTSSFYNSFANQHKEFPDSSNLPSTIVTGKPISTSTSPNAVGKTRTKTQFIQNSDHILSNDQISNHNVRNNNPNNGKPHTEDEEYDDDNESSEENENESSENDSSERDKNRPNDHFEHDFPEPPYEFTHPNHKYKDIENPFANPNFDFDAFLSKLSGNQYSVASSPKLKHNQNIKNVINTGEIATVSNHNSNIKSSSLNYKGMSTPRPFNEVSLTNRPSATNQNLYIETWSQRPQTHQVQQQSQEQHRQLNQDPHQVPQQSAGVYVESNRPKLKPPNFKDDRQLPINYSFSKLGSSTEKPNAHRHTNRENPQFATQTQKPFIILSSTGKPPILSSPKQYLIKPEKIITLHPHYVSTMKPYLVSSNPFIAYKHSTAKPLTTVANQQLSALQHFWGSTPPPSDSHSPNQSSVRPSELPKLENLFSQSVRPSIASTKTNSTTRLLSSRRPIPKPSPEMNDYYYDENEDEQYDYEPPVKSKYMPSTEIKPQRPLMAQNYKEYEDSSEEDGDSDKTKNKYYSRRPEMFTTRRPETFTKNYNDVSVMTKGSIKDISKNVNDKAPIPVLVSYATPASTVLMRPETFKYNIIHHSQNKNKTVHIRKPMYSDSGPFTVKPPKYLNQTTLRPYTVRHRLARPSSTSQPFNQNDDFKQMRGRMRHQNIVAHMKYTTPRDNHNQETRFTKTKHDDKTNSLGPTESVTPISYSASPRPKMLYNGSQNYNPDQYDPFYAVYDEDGELYKDTDYVQQYNTASLRPAVQQTYRGTPPPARRPVETYSPRPVSPDDYDDALIQGQISNQNQYQPPTRHPTRGDVNELGYDHNPSSVRTTIYEATTISTTPSTTTSTSTTTQRSTTAPFTEAMTSSRYTLRSSTDKSPIQIPIPSEDKSSTDEANNPIILSNSPSISSLAKPFQKTDNSHRLTETLLPTDKTTTSQIIPENTNYNPEVHLEAVKPPNESNKKVLSLTTGFSFRRNVNNTNNPYTLTVLSRPFDNYNKSRNQHLPEIDNSEEKQPRGYYQYSSDDSQDPVSTKTTTVKNYAPSLVQYHSAHIQSKSESSPSLLTRQKGRRPTTKMMSLYNTEPTVSTGTTKYYLKSVVRRPAMFSSNNNNKNDFEHAEIYYNATENESSSELPDHLSKNFDSEEVSETPSYSTSTSDPWDGAVISPYRSLDTLRGTSQNKDNLIQESTTAPSTTTFSSFSPRNYRVEKPRSKPSYYSYKLVDEFVPDQTTEVFSGKVKNVLKAFFNNLVSTPTPRLLEEFSITTAKTTAEPTEKVVNIGFHKKMLKYVDEKPLRQNVKRLQIITDATEPTVNKFISSNDDVLDITESEFNSHFLSNSKSTSSIPLLVSEPTTQVMIESSTNKANLNLVPTRQSFESRFIGFTSSSSTSAKPEEKKSHKFQKLIHDTLTENDYDKESYKIPDQITTTLRTVTDSSRIPTSVNWNRITDKISSETASTTSTTKATSTVRVEPTLLTKSLSFPTRASRVNPAIKLAATNPGGGRRSYQSSSKCSTDNSLQANPKCNEIKYQRPSSTRGRGSAHYSTASDGPQPIPNRGTPPTRNRPTLKPSTAIVSKNVEYVDIYTNPPGRPAPVYPQPTPDKTAAKCRKDVCLLPDCYCGGKDIPGDMPVETVPQIVLLTFDDSVNDLNKGLYADLFEKGRVNPNGCPISATFYVSHEWTDYSQVQNLYSAGHEMASHTVSHSFGEQFSQKKWNREVAGQREILAAYGGVNLDDVRGMRAPFLSVGGNKMFKMLYDSNFTYDSSLPVYENKPPSWPYTLDYKLFHDCMIPPCPTKSYPGVWEVPMVMWQDLNGGRCSMGDACANPPEAENVYKMILKNFDRHYTTNRAPFGLYYHAAWFTQPHHKEGFTMFLDFINQMSDVWIVTNWQALQWVRDPTPISRINNFQPFQCNYQDRPKKCNNPKVCNLWHKSGVRYMRTCQPCPEVYPWTGKSGIKSSRIDNDIGE